MYFQSEEKLIVCGLVAHVCVPSTQPHVPSMVANTGAGGGEAARREGAQLKAAQARHIASKEDVAVACMVPVSGGSASRALGRCYLRTSSSAAPVVDSTKSGTRPLGRWARRDTGCPWSTATRPRSGPPPRRGDLRAAPEFLCVIMQLRALRFGRFGQHPSPVVWRWRPVHETGGGAGVRIEP